MRLLTLATTFLIAFFLVGLSGIGYSQTTITEILDTPGAGSWIAPCGVTSATIEVYGGGGGGGGSNSNTIGGGGGGAGGYAQWTWNNIIPGNAYPYVVGSGGVGGGPAGNGGPGSQSNWNGGVLVGWGGTGGLAENNGGTGGTGGTGSAWAINGTGGNGGQGVDPNGGGGGSAQGPNGGGGGAGAGAGLTGGNGGTYGGGGGGGGKKAGSSFGYGGQGSTGAVIITYTLPYDAPDAGIDVSTCNLITMTANAPSAGWTGTWNIISGAPIIADIHDPNSVVTIPAPGTCAVLEWEFTMAGCQTMTDQVTVCYPLLCNDDPCGGIDVPLPVNSGGCSYNTYSNIDATASTGMVEPGCGDWSDNDAWYSVTVPASGVVTISGTDAPGGATMEIGMAIYSAGAGGCNDVYHEGCDFATSTSDAAELTYTGTPGEVIYIRIWDVDEEEGTYQLCAFEPATPTGDILPGATTINCGTTYTFLDPGGDGGNYQNNTTAYYTICPDTPGQYVSIDFSTGPNFFDTELNNDFLTVLDGAYDSSYVIGQYSGAVNPLIITSSTPDGCLTLIFASDNSITDLGWEADVSCSAVPGVNDSTCTGTDCPGECGTWICQTGLYPAENIGNVTEDMSIGSGGCFDQVGEVATQWFYFTALSTGTVEFSFSGPGGQDYNFAIFGPNMDGEPPCPQTTGDAPVICSQADVGNYSINGITGLSATLGAGQSYEGPEGDGWVDALNVTAGETYSMLVNIYQNGGPQPVIDLVVGGTGQLDCTPVFLPIELLSFNGINQGGHNLLTWVTSSEINNDYFTVERSINGMDWEVVDIVDGAGTSYHSLYYELVDENPYFPVTYYRLKQTDFDGKYKYFEVISISGQKMEGDFVSVLFPNPTDTYSTFTYNGKDTESPLVVQVYNELGSVVMEQVFDHPYPEMPATLRTDQLRYGMYQVVFSQGEKREIQKLSVLK